MTSDDAIDPIFSPAPAPGLCVRIMDLSGANGSDPIEVVTGFGSLGHANTFARRYVRDSLERCRMPGMSADEVVAAWFAFGEDAEVEGGAEGAVWRTETELHDFAARALEDGAEQRDWRMLDPRRDGADAPFALHDGLDDEEDDADEEEDADAEDEA